MHTRKNNLFLEGGKLLNTTWYKQDSNIDQQIFNLILFNHKKDADVKVLPYKTKEINHICLKS